MSRDPGYVQTVEHAKWQMEHARDLDAALLQDPAVQAHRAEMVQQFMRGALTPKQAEELVVRQAITIRAVARWDRQAISSESRMAGEGRRPSKDFSALELPK